MKKLFFFLISITLILTFLSANAADDEEFPLDGAFDSDARIIEFTNNSSCDVTNIELDIFPPKANAMSRLMGKGRHSLRIKSINKGEHVKLSYSDFADSDGIRMPNEYIPGQLFISGTSCGQDISNSYYISN